MRVGLAGATTIATALVLTLTAASPVERPITDSFERYTAGPLNEGTSFGPWSVTWDGYGSVAIAGHPKDQELHLAPQTVTSPHETSAALVLSNYSLATCYTLRAELGLTEQLRQGSPANPWESPWLVWSYDNNDFYYLAMKTNGWEIGAHLADLNPEQVFIATGPAPFISEGDTVDVSVRLKNGVFRVRANGQHLASFPSDLVHHDGHAGTVGFYTEDAAITVDDVRTRTCR